MGFTENFYKELEKQKKKKKEDSEDDIAPVSTGGSFSSNFYSELEKTGFDRSSIPVIRESTSKKDDVAPLSSEEDEKRTWFKKGAFEDGYQFGDIIKTVEGTLTDLRGDIMEGVLGIGEGAIDAGATLIGGVGKFFGADGFADTMSGFVEKDIINEEKVSRAIIKGTQAPLSTLWSNDYEDLSVFGDKTDSLVQSGGQLLGQIGLQAVGVPWWVTSGVTSFGSSAEEAFRNDASYGEAVVSSAISAGAEILTEKIFRGSGLGEKGFINTEVLTKGIANKSVKALFDFGIDVLGEGFEEVASEFFSILGKQLTYEKEETWEEILNNEDAMDAYLYQVIDSLFGEEAREAYGEAFIGGAVLGGAMNSVKVGNSIKNKTDYHTGLTANEQKVFDSEYKKRLAEKGDNVSNRDKKKLRDDLLEEIKRGYIDTDTIESVLGGETYEGYKNLTAQETSLIERKKAIASEIKSLVSTPEMQFTVEQREKLNSLIQEARGVEERLKGLGIETAKSNLFNEVQKLTEKDTFLRESYRDLIRKGQDIQIDDTQYKGTKFEDAAKKTIENARKAGANNSNRVRDFVELSARYSSQSGVVVDFQSDGQIRQILKNQLQAEINTLQKSTAEADKTKLAELQDMLKQVQEGKITVNGVKTKDGVAINIKSPNYLNTVLGHEVTHFLENTSAYKDLQAAIFRYAKLKKDYDGRRKVLDILYKNVDGTTVNSELTADLVGDYLFTEYDFIKDLSTNHRNVFQKVYDRIKYMFKLATAGSKEARELEKVMHHFERALRESTETAQKSSKAVQGEPDVDAEIKFSIRQGDPPKKTIKGYKVFKVVDGKLYPPMVENPSGNGTPVGVWLDADVGGLAYNKDGSVKLNTKGRFAVESSQGGSLAFRPGWHLGEYPDASQFGRMDTSHPLTEEELATYEGKTYKDKNGNVYPMNLFPYNFVWAECEVAADHDYQLDAMALGVNEKGNFVRSQAGLPYVPSDGYYKYRTNADPNTAPWIISGAIKVNKILDDADVAEICAQYGVTPQTREGYTDLKKKDGGSRTPGNAINLSDFKLIRGDVTPTDANTLAEISMSDGLARERSATAMGLLKTLPGYAKRKINFSDENIIKEFGMNNQDVEYYRNLAESTRDGYLADDKLYSGDGVKYSLSKDSNGNQLSPAVQKRFGKSKAVDENGNLKVLYHGTASGEFFTFDKSKGSVDGDFGSGFYFTDNESDVENNYEGGGADFENKVARRAEQIKAEEDVSYSEAEARAREELYVGSNKFEVYLNIENPAIVGETNLLDYDSFTEDFDRDDYDSDEDYESDIEYHIADEIDSIIWDIQKNIDVYSTDGIAEVLWNAINEGGIDVEQLKANINNLYLEDSSTGELVGNEVTRQIIESLGYDGIIDSTVSSKFNMGLDEGTTHYIVFKPNQIKDISNQNPTDNPDIRYSLSYGSKIINILTNEEISEKTYEVLERLERGENVPLSELATLKEVKEGIQQRDSLTKRFIANHPELKSVPFEKVGTHLLQTAERERVREEILEKRLKEGSFTGIDKNGKEVYNGSVEKGKRLDIVIGVPAAGKSSAIVNPISQYYKSMVIDSDIVKGELPEYNGGWGASLVHEESSDINAKLFDRAIQTGSNIVLPIVGSKTSSVEDYLLLAKAQGYDVYLHLNELPGGKAMGRVLRRYFHNGRFIEPAIAGKYGNKPTEVYEKMKARGDLSGYSRWNNDVARGQRPVFRDGSEGLEAYREFSDSWRASRTPDTVGGVGQSSQGTDAHLGDGVGGSQGFVGAVSPRGENSEGSIGLPKFVRLNPKTQEALSQSGVVSLELIDSSSDSNAFSHALSEARTSDEKNGWAVTPKSAEELVENNIRTIMTSDGKAGLGVAPDGDIEAVFKNQKGGQPGVLKTLIPAALEMGGNKLDCYGDGLVKLYARYGFVPVARLTFNPEYANDGWTPDKGMPDIFFMVHNGDSADTVAANIGKYKAWTTEELNALPLFDKDAYDDAYAYRDSLLPEDIAPTSTFSLSNEGEQRNLGGNYRFDGKGFQVQPSEDIAPVATENVQETSQIPTENVQVDEPNRAEVVEKLIEGDIAKLQEEYKKKRATLEEETKDKNAFVIKRAMELYNELSRLKKGVKASKELGYLLDYGYPWSEIKSTLLKVKLSPDQVINPDSVVESLVREAVNAEYENKVYELDDIDNDYKEQEARLRAQAMKDNGQSVAVLEKISAKLKNLQTELENNRRLQRESNADFDSEIARLQAEYDAKKNKNTKVANDILRRIERIQRLKASVDADYSKRITSLSERIKKMNTPQYKRGEQRRAKQDKWSSEIREMIGDTSTWRDKKLGISYQTNTLHRNLRDVVRDASGKQDIAKADAIYEYLQGSYNHNEAQLKRESRDIKKRFADMKINKYESVYIQMLGEFKYNPETKLTLEAVDEYFNKHKDKIDLDKVNKAIEESRKVYDDLYKRVNAVLREMGLKEIGYKEGYFPHFTETKQSWLGKLFNWKTIDTEIPTDIAGLTEEFNPVRTYQSFDKHRKSADTDYNFLKGFDTYVHGALDWIYHIEDIQKRRAFENEIRYSHSEQGIRDKIDELRSQDLDADALQAAMDQVYETAKNPLNNFVTDLRNSTNNLAGKKSTTDRSMEYATNRKVYSTMTNISSRVTGNMVVGSISSAMTNFIPITQSWGQVSPVSSLRAVGDMVRNAFRDDGMIKKSDFMTNRLLNEENLNQTGWDKASNIAGGLMNIFDHISTEVVWRSKYLENMSKGMSESEAIHDADIFAENVMAGRSRGNTPTIYNSKNPVTKMLTAFQLEVANQYGYMFKDMPQDIGKKNIGKLTAGYAKMFIGAYVYNALFSQLTGRDAAFDPIGILEDLLKDLGFGDDDEEEEVDVLGAVEGLGENILQEVPYVGGLLGGGRVPISSALPYDDVVEMFTGTIGDVTDKDWGNLTKEWLKPVYYVAMPFGGGQLKKTVEGLSMFSDEHPVSGSYTTSGNLRYPVEDTPLNKIQAALFGQYASENAREYFDEGYAPLNENQIQEYIDVDLPIKDYWEYREGLNDLAPLPGSQSVTLEQQADYIDSLDLPTSKKNILINNLTDRKTPVDMTSYGDYDSLEEFDFATKYPDRYAVAKSVGGYSAYKKYADSLNDIKSDKDKNGKTISGSRKEKVLQYINSLDADYGTKIILLKSEYPSDDTYNMEIIDYVNGRADLTYEERVAIFTELGFRVSNGNIYAD